MPDVRVVLPYRETAERPPLAVAVTRWYENAGYTVNTVDSEQGKPFSRAQARNRAASYAELVGADVVVIADADIIPELSSLHKAISDARYGRLQLPYTHYRALSRTSTHEYLRNSAMDLSTATTDMETDWSTGGVLVIRPDAWFKAGGMDERFLGWGGEDTAFRIACDALLGPTRRHSGTIHHLWHPNEYRPHTDQYKANMALAARYDHAEGSAEAITALISERLDP